MNIGELRHRHYTDRQANYDVRELLGELDAQAAALKTAQTCPRCKGTTIDPDSKPDYYDGHPEPGSFDPCDLCHGGEREPFTLAAVYEDLEAVFLHLFAPTIPPLIRNAQLTQRIETLTAEVERYKRVLTDLVRAEARAVLAGGEQT